MQQEDQKTNRLINSTSPYLLQHANNPVDWYEWGEEALEKAKRENKPILVSIGYSSCHWCHVMEHESFENEDIAAIMNENFVSIKVDREERPDIDQIYMEAVQAMGINGGWPLNVFITPDQKPFYGGTYFPPKNWSQLLIQISKVYKEKREDINKSADELARQLASSDLDRFRRQGMDGDLNSKGSKQMFDSLHSKFDSEWGGLDKAPKFVMPTQWLFLLRHYAKTKDKTALDMVELTLKKMAMGGLYDQVGGGFARYSVDGRWFAPHFEKMLYDNAQLLSLYSEAYAVTRDEFYKRVVYETAEWVQREMTSEDGGFYSALDADSEGEEGKYYVWKQQEFHSVTQRQPDWLIDYYSVTDSGNWEHGNNILFIEKSEQQFISEHNITSQQLHNEIDKAKKLLLTSRNERVKPGLDDKVLTAWNAMTIHGLLDAYAAFGEAKFLDMAIANIQFLEKNLIDEKVFR
ncbi:MAG: thioredoxin domain-containing protein, partial [Cyclobacteriaceae bacterium]